MSAAIDNNKKYLFVINPKSFGFDNVRIQKFTNSVQSVFNKITTQDNNNYDYSFYCSNFPRDAINYLSKIVESTPKTQTIRVFAVGGDGILFECLNGIAGFDNCELANIPYGKSNDFIAGFDKNTRKFLDLQKQLSAPAIPVDAISDGTNYALNMVLTGIEAEACSWTYRFIDAHKKFFARFPKIGGKVFLLAGIVCLFNRKSMRRVYKIKIDDEEETEERLTSINIANSSTYGGKRTVITEASPSDGILNVLGMRSMSLLRAVKVISNYLKGKWRKYSDNFMYKIAKRIKISSDAPMTINIDGEVFYDSQLNLKIIPNAVKFVTLNDMKNGE